MQEPATLNPFTAVGAVALRAVLRYTHDALADVDPQTGALRPALAERWTIQDGGRRIRFSLRRGVEFSDGTPLTRADAAFTFALARIDGLPLGALGDVLAPVRALHLVGERDLEFELGEVTATALPRLATGFLVVSEAHWRKVLGLGTADTASALRDAGLAARVRAVDRPGPGSGPFHVAQWEPGSFLRLAHNPHSWRRAERPEDWNLAALSLRFVQDPAARFTMLRQGELDVFDDPNAEQLIARHPELAETHRPLTYDHVGLGHFAVVWNHRRPPFGDRRVRTALSQCIDRPGMARELFAGHARVSRGWFRPESKLDAESPDNAPRFDPDAARRQLAAAGIAAPRLHLMIAAGQAQHRRIVEFLAPSFLRAGVTLIAAPLEWGTLVTRLRAHDFDGVLLHISLPQWPDPFLQFHSSQAAGGRNWAGYRDGEADAVLTKAHTEPDPVARHALLLEFQRLFVRDQPISLLVYPLSSVLLHRRFQGVELGVLGLYPERWWVTGK
ncbi:MAG: hypothetical protein KDC87_09120 [Planctomycetes bacterium]|nr:hypothetical protein [Planctomycetota bacterium]